MCLSEVLDQIREMVVNRRTSAGDSLWSVILKQIRDQDYIDGQYADTVADVIRPFVTRLNDATAISVWRQTETGMSDDTVDDALFPDCVRMDLEMELLRAVISLAWEEAHEEN